MIFDFIVVGAGMAGSSLGRELAELGSVLILEAEALAGYHATGRSAAFWQESYGGPQVQPLTLASFDFLSNPPEGFADRSFLTPRSALTLARIGQEKELRHFIDRFAAVGVEMRELGRPEIENIIPALDEAFVLAALEPSCCDIDVAALHHAYLGDAQRRGVQIRYSTSVENAERDGDLWRILTGQEEFLARTVINAAGAWADEVAEAFGAAALGIRPYRRTMVQARLQGEVDNSLPLVMDISQQFYFKPESGRLWLTPHDEGEADPGDVAPEELDVAIAIDRVEKATHWHVEAVERKWAGLRSFAPDRLPVYGLDTKVPGFFWFAGQGGFGIQTAPAAAKLAAHLLGAGADSMISKLDPATYSPRRFVRA